MNKVYSIIVTYNGAQWIEKCLDSLENSIVKTDIIVIDNNSSDNTVAIIESKYPAIHLIKSERNLGFGQANNIGMRKALDENADYVFLLNQDAWLAKTDAIEQLIIAHKTNEDYGIISPIQLYGSGKKIVKSMEVNLSKSAIKKSDMVSDIFFKRPLKNIYSIDYVCAASWLLPISVIKEIGGFDPVFFHYGEDDNYMHRILFHGYKIGVCPFASICHDIGDRDKSQRRKHNDRQKCLMVELSNINEIENLNKLMSFYLYTAFTKVFFLRIRAVINNFKTANFIFKNKKRLCEHRCKNTIKGTNWL